MGGSKSKQNLADFVYDGCATRLLFTQGFSHSDASDENRSNNSGRETCNALAVNFDLDASDACTGMSKALLIRPFLTFALSVSGC